MLLRVRSRLQRLLADTPVEPLARSALRAYRKLVPRAASAMERKTVEYDRMTAEVAARSLSSGGVCVDAGANKGDLLRMFMAAAPQATFIAFEPIPELAKRLARQFPGASIRALALSDTTGEAEFRHFPDRQALSSLVVRPERETGAAVETITVQVGTLDDAVPERPVRFVKVDVEGVELALLRGARRILREERPVVVLECGGEDNLIAVHDELESSGYAVWTMAGWLQAGEQLRGPAGVLAAADAGEWQFVAAPVGPPPG